jgi:ATP-dependent RNA helicase MSS116
VDYPDVTHVIQYGSAECPETYIHRLGRTGRAGKKGQGLVIMESPEEQRQFVGDALQGLDVTWDAQAQRAMEGAERGDDGDDRAEQRRQGNEERLARVRSEVATPGSDLQEAASHAYKSLLGYHATKTQNLGMTKQQMVNYVNDLARQMGFVDWRYQALNLKVVQTLKLRGIPGVNVVHDHGSFGSSRGRYGDDRSCGGYGHGDEGGATATAENVGAGKNAMEAEAEAIPSTRTPILETVLVVTSNHR